MLLYTIFSMRRFLFPATVLAILIITYTKLERFAFYRDTRLQDISVVSANASLFGEHVKFWRALDSILSSNPPGIEKVHKTGNAKVDRYDAAADPVPRPELIEMSEEEVDTMKESHESVVKSITDNPPMMAFAEGTKGIVSTAGGVYLPLIVISLRLLRRTGSKLPAEIFLASNAEYESFICETILPSLNAKCIILSEILDAVPRSVDVTHYQLKIFAIMFSSFEEVLFLDADTFPAHDPQQLFEKEPFKSDGYVLWNDFWFCTESPHFFTITSQEMPLLNQRATIEAGEILVSKKKHYKSLMLASYYNLYGPGLYYPLLSQGAPGEGDKETFAVAAAALNESYYLVKQSVVAIGHATETGWAGSAMVQHDPQEDYVFTQQKVRGSGSSPPAPSPRPFFVHVNFPKFNPAKIYDDDIVLRHPNGTYRRAWADPQETIQQFDYDVEKRFWEEAMWAACNLEGRVRDWRNSEKICGKAKGYYREIYE